MKRSRTKALWPICIFLFVFAMWPYRSRSLDVREFSIPLQIQISRTSPVFAAKEDLAIPIIREFPEQELRLRRGQILLHSGASAIDPRIFKAPTPKSRLLASAFSKRMNFLSGMIIHSENVRTLAGLTISRGDLEVVRNVYPTTMSGRLATALASTNRPVPETSSAALRAGIQSQPEMRQQFLEALPERLRIRAEKIPQLAQTLTQDYSDSNIALETKLNSLLQNADLIHSVEHHAREPNSVFSTAPSIIKPTNIPTQAANTIVPPAKDPLGSPKTLASRSAPAAAPGLMDAVLPPLNSIQGTIELRDGLAFFGSSKGLTISQRIAGNDVAKASISVQTGRYVLVPLRPGEGELVAELRTPDGLLMGRESYPLDNLKTGTLNLKIEPISAAVHGSVVFVANAAASTSAGIDVLIAGTTQSVRTNAQAQFTKSGYIRESNYIFAVREAGFATGLAVASTEQAPKVGLLPNTVVNSWINQAMTPSQARNFGTIYGHVTASSRGLQSAKITVDDAHAKVIYLDENLRVSDLPMTGAGGGFAVVGLGAGFHSVAAEFENGKTIVRGVVVDAGTVSTLELSPAPKKAVTTYIYDAITGAAMNAQVNLQGEDKSAVSEGGKLRINVQQVEGYIALGFESGPGYVPANRLCSRTTNSVNIPMLRTDWVQGLEDQLGNSRKVGRGYIVGFVRGEGFLVDEGRLAFDSDSKVIYFDASGKLVANRTTLSAKASTAVGFLITNVPQGVHSVGIQLLGHAEIGNQIVVVQPGEVSLLDWNL